METKKILIAGGTGLVGQELTALLEKQGHQVAFLSRSAVLNKVSFIWDYKKEYIDPEAFKWADIIVHLAGRSVADGRWTEKAKKEILESRVLTTRLLKSGLEKSGEQIEQFVAASAVGIYEYGDDVRTEESPAAHHFLADVVKQWEQELFTFEEINVPTLAIRIGVVLSIDGGALPKLTQPIKLGVGADLGTGKQWTPWIHIEDLAEIFAFGISKKLSGIYNGVAPNCVSNTELNQACAQSLGKTLWAPNVPAWFLKILLGEMAVVVLEGTRVSADKIKKEGFTFKYETIQSATDALLS